MLVRPREDHREIMNSTLLILTMLATYLVTAIPTGVLLAKVMGFEDVRRSGSGNIGATNVYRVAGKLPGILTLLGDILKGALPLLVITRWLGPTPGQLGLLALIAIIGHCYPVYLGFRGGKGVATGLGIFLVLSPISVVLAAALFLVAVAVSRYISLGSVLAALSMPLWVLFLGYPREIFAGSLGIALLIVWRHRSNIRRMLDGTENRFKT